MTDPRPTAAIEDQPRTVLIGTLASCRALRSALGAQTPPVGVSGFVTIDAGDSGAAGTDADPLLGPAHAVGLICRQHGVRRAIVTLPDAHRDWHAEISRQLRAEGVVERVIRPLADQLAFPEPAPMPGVGAESAGLRGVDLARLVGRTPHGIDEALVGSTVRGRTVLVTGAGGSIGSELVRRLARFAPERIVLMERSENALFEIDRHLGELHPGVARSALLHDVVDRERTLAHLDRLRPDVVFHAAAHKHVPLMEDHPAHAVTNNLFGTRSIADASDATGVERFVLISTDKAVNPASVMGATKRLAEWYVQSLAARSSTRMSMVRFGNVLGSNGSVLTIWAEQAARGGPITVTDERMTRFFMTIPEAATLVLQACAMSGRDGRTGEVFVLDMGEPIGVLGLAERFARSRGLEPVRTTPGQSAPMGAGRIAIAVTGARPGEKLHEQLSYDAESLCTTAHPGIWRLDSETSPGAGAVATMVEDLTQAVETGVRRSVLDAMARHLPGLLGTHKATAAA